MDHELATLLQAVKSAGLAVNKLQPKNSFISSKTNNSPLSEADLLANTILKKHLLQAFPQDGWLSEETIDDQARLNSNRVWIVDPIDGTKEFLQGIPEFSISVALIENGTPKLAAVLNPATDELFHAVADHGSWLNNQPIQCNLTYQNKLTILASRSEFNKGKWQDYQNQNIIPVGSIAYKLARLAAGFAHATFTLSPRSEWDIAAGVLLVQAAGGIVTDKLQLPLQFNQQYTRVNGVIAASKQTFPLITQLIKEHAL